MKDLSVTMYALFGVRTQRHEDAKTQKNCLIASLPYYRFAFGIRRLVWIVVVLGV